MMTQTVGNDWVVLQAEDHGYDIEEGSVFHWSDSFCSRMVQGIGPRVAPRAQIIPTYASAGINRQVPIGAYIGVPVTNQDGSLFGTLCGIDPSEHPEEIIDMLPLVELQARFLGTVLDREAQSRKCSKLLRLCEIEKTKDGLTHLLNRRGWQECIAREENRLERYGGETSVLIIDLDDLKKINDTCGHAQGDALLQRTASCLRTVVRKSDFIARIGGDEFAILANACGDNGLQTLHSKIVSVLSNNEISASVGKATLASEGTLSEAIGQADADMYVVKSLRKFKKLN